MLPDHMDIIKMKNQHGMKTRELARNLDNEPTASWINQVEHGRIKDPSYRMIKKIADYFEGLSLTSRGNVAVGTKASKIIWHKIGDSLEMVQNNMIQRGISQVLIKYRNQPVGMLTDQEIFRVRSLGQKNPRISEDFLAPLPPIIQYDEPIGKVVNMFEIYQCIVIETNGQITHIMTIQDMIKHGFQKDKPSKRRT